jgi:hypothetical protein
MDKEIWRPVVGSQGFYEVSSTGRVKTLGLKSGVGKGHFDRPEKILKQSKDDNGYFIVSIRRDGKMKTSAVHKLVAEAFLGHIPCGYKIVVDHIDNNHQNNNFSNLQLISQRENGSKDRYIGISGLRGVSLTENDKWKSRIIIKGVRISLGSYDSKEEAKDMYDKAISLEDKFENKEQFEKLIGVKRIKVTSKYRGVSFNTKKKKWIAQTKHKGKPIYIGIFKSEEDAYKAYLEKRKEIDQL